MVVIFIIAISLKFTFFATNLKSRNAVYVNSNTTNLNTLGLNYSQFGNSQNSPPKTAKRNLKLKQKVYKLADRQTFVYKKSAEVTDSFINLNFLYILMISLVQLPLSIEADSEFEKDSLFDYSEIGNEDDVIEKSPNFNWQEEFDNRVSEDFTMRIWKF